MSVARCREINARLRAAGITVYEWPGWETRGNGQTSRYEGGLPHHTGSSFGSALPGSGIGNLLVTGRTDLSGPLCNYAGNADGSLTLIAAHPANHAGASGGRSMGPLPVTTLFNPRVLGLEIVYPGTVPMRDAQYRAALVWARVVAEVCGGGDIQRIRAHGETSITGKWDPGDAPGRTINMAAFRAAALIKPEDDMAFTESSQAQLSDIQLRLASMHAGQFLPWPGVPGAPGGDLRWFQQQASTALAPLKAMLAQIVANQQDDVSDGDVLAALGSHMATIHTELAEQQKSQLDQFRVDAVQVLNAGLQEIRDALSQGDTAQAQAIVAELARRLAPPQSEGSTP